MHVHTHHQALCSTCDVGSTTLCREKPGSTGPGSPAWSSVSCSQLSFVQAANIASRYKWKDTRGVFKGHCKQGAADLFAKEDKLIWLAATRCPLKVIESLDPTALKNNEELSIWYLIWDGGGIVYCPTQPSCIAHFDLCQLSYLGVGDTLSDSIQCLNFAETWFNSIFVSISLTQNSIQTIIQFKTNSTDLIQKILQFNSQKVSKIDKKTGAFHQKWQISIQHTIYSFISR